jgi:protein-tyrosine phosphatase
MESIKEITNQELKQMLNYSIDELVKHLKSINKRLDYYSFQDDLEKDAKKQEEIIDILDFISQKIK